ncbi:MAG: glycogen synthase GlgA [Rhodocyclaceae bacterium]|nr:glycogen synthase GlgA [Rhodocyclaceae bacterium]
MPTSAPLRLLFATSEIAPWVKTGGLGDVAAALPEALHRSGMDVRVLVPAYPAMKAAFPLAHTLVGIAAPGGLLPPCRILEASAPSGLTIWLLDCPELFIRPGGPYQTPDGPDWPDNPLRFALLSRVAAILSSDASPLEWRPQIVHGNDWQTGLIPAYLHFMPGRRPRTVMTIHNLAFQGNFPQQWLSDLGLPWDAWHLEGAEFHGYLSFLKAGLYYCDRITTVSPTYAREICSDELGFGMAGLLQHRAPVLSGILNGIDDAVWNPADDSSLAAAYDGEHLEGKAANKAELQRLMGLAVTPEKPLLGVVSRLTHQKGLDWVAAVGEQLVQAGMQLAVLGSGDKGLQGAFSDLAQRYPDSVGVRIGYDEGLSHQIEAGADIFLMPSRFEPCGLNQMYSLRYGTPPLVRPTGGLADTVTDCNDATLANGSATGFVMPGADAEALLSTVYRAVARWRDKDGWRALQRNGMARDFSWTRAAQSYLALYRQLA